MNTSIDASRAWLHFIVANGVYVLLVVPLQEFVCRGVLQEQLERLLSPPRARGWAIVTSSAAFGACHLYLSWGVAAATVVLSAYIGVIYGRTRNLAGACVLHAIVGAWALSVVRLQPLLAGAP